MQLAPASETARTSMNRIDAAAEPICASVEFGARPLQREEAAILQGFDGADFGQSLANEHFVGGLAAGIDHQHEMITAMGNHEVVDDAAIGVGEKTVAQPERRQAQHISRYQQFESPRGILNSPGARTYRDLAHMRDVEQAGRSTRVQMFFENSKRIIDRHLVAGKRSDRCAQLKMKIVERQAPERRVLMICTGAHRNTRARRKKQLAGCVGTVCGGATAMEPPSNLWVETALDIGAPCQHGADQFRCPLCIFA